MYEPRQADELTDSRTRRGTRNGMFAWPRRRSCTKRKCADALASVIGERWREMESVESVISPPTETRQCDPQAGICEGVMGRWGCVGQLGDLTTAIGQDQQRSFTSLPHECHVNVNEHARTTCRHCYSMQDVSRSRK